MRLDVFDTQEILVASMAEYFYLFENTITAVKATNNVFANTNTTAQWSLAVDTQMFKTLEINFYTNLMTNADTVATATAMYQVYDAKNQAWVNTLATALALGSYSAGATQTAPVPLIASQVLTGYTGLMRVGISCLTAGTSSSTGYFQIQMIGQTG